MASYSWADDANRVWHWLPARCGARIDGANEMPRDPRTLPDWPIENESVCSRCAKAFAESGHG